MWGIIVGLIFLVGVGWWWNIQTILVEGGGGLQALWEEVQGTGQDVKEQTQDSRAQLSESFDTIKEIMEGVVDEEVKTQITTKVAEDMKQTIEESQGQEGEMTGSESLQEQTNP